MSLRDESRDGFNNKLEGYVLTHFRLLWEFINGTGWLGDIVNRIVIGRAVLKAKPRPHQFSTKAGYTSWATLTDRNYFGRHLPPKDMGELPDPNAMLDLFRIPAEGGQRMSEKSTFLFASFAQWFTDGFLMTVDNDRTRTSSSHQIDLNPLYGQTDAETGDLRLKANRPGEKGRLRSVMRDGEEFADTLFEPGTHRNKQQFANLRAPINMNRNGPWPYAKSDTIFAFGGDRANTTPVTAALNTLFLREHNRVAGIIEAVKPAWDDDRVFETARNIMIVLLIKLVVEEYINHISPYWFRFRAKPQAAWRARWNKPNWIAAEFNLLYRWHGLAPEAFAFDGAMVPAREIIIDNTLLMRGGLARLFDQASRQRAGDLGLFNTATAIRWVEAAAIKQGRDSEIASYNDYRAAMGFPRVTAFNQINGHPDVIAGLQRHYGHVDRIEYFVGLFAEEGRTGSAVPPLIGRMVALDAFSQALTNPLLSENVYNAQTFTDEGMAIIESTGRLKDIVLRNTTSTAAPQVSFDRI
jgi:prostaglandin-endoperoxide synthase 2